MMAGMRKAFRVAGWILFAPVAFLIGPAVIIAIAAVLYFAFEYRAIAFWVALAAVTLWLSWPLTVRLPRRWR